MGLSLTVGILADLREHDEDGAQWTRDAFKVANAVLADHGVERHREPENCRPWFADCWGYHGIHALREIAALVWRRKEVPRSRLLTGEGSFPNYSALIRVALPFCTGARKPGLWGRIMNGGAPDLPPFSHLVCHSDSEGFYVPIDFPAPLLPKEWSEDFDTLWPLGSVQRLDGELDQLLGILEIPDDRVFGDLGTAEKTTPLEDELLALLDGQTHQAEGPLWKAQPIAAHSALILKRACREAMRTGAAITFG